LIVLSDKPVAAICHGSWMLCSAKCIQGRRMTCFIACKDDIENAGSVCQLSLQISSLTVTLVTLLMFASSLSNLVVRLQCESKKIPPPEVI